MEKLHNALIDDGGLRGCAAIEWIKPLFLEGGRFLSQEGKQVALLGQVYSGEQLDYLPAMMGGAETVVINDLDWQVCGKTIVQVITFRKNAGNRS